MHDYPDHSEEEELELAREAMAMAEQMVRHAYYLCLEPLPSPSTEELVAVQAFFPQTASHELRREMIAGRVRIGPFLPGPVFDFAQASLRGAGVQWHSEPPNAQDLARFGIAPR